MSLLILADPHASRGSLESGNSSIINGSDVVTTVRDVDLGLSIAPFSDVIPQSSLLPALTSMQHAQRSTTPAWIDVRLVRNVVTSLLEDQPLISAFSMMTGSTDNYVRYNQVSATCGWCYDNESVGTSSLAFGGMTY